MALDEKKNAVSEEEEEEEEENDGGNGHADLTGPLYPTFECVEYKVCGSPDLLEVEKYPVRMAIERWGDPPDNDDDSVTKVLSHKLGQAPSLNDKFEFPSDVTSKMGLKDECGEVVLSDGTGTIALISAPEIRFVVQTPLDGGPFCFMNVQRLGGFDCSTLHLYSDPLFAPLRVLADQTWLLRWRWGGLPMLILPIVFAQAHDKYIASRIQELRGELASIEHALLGPDSVPSANRRHRRHDPAAAAAGHLAMSIDFGQLTRRLHGFSTGLTNLVRRAHFQDTILSVVGDTLNGLNDRQANELRTVKLAPLETAMQGRRYDLEMLPQREQTARTTIFNLILQHDQTIALTMARTNLTIAATSQRIASAAARDSAAMRTIAVLTMLFLPGTAVASFFSMTMFDWTPNAAADGVSGGTRSGGNTKVVSGYLWVYFAVALPFTLAVLLGWWLWQRRVAVGERVEEEDEVGMALLLEQQMRGVRLRKELEGGGGEGGRRSVDAGAAGVDR